MLLEPLPFGLGHPAILVVRAQLAPTSQVQLVVPASGLAQREVFGPVLAITPFSTDDEAIALANGTEYGLSAYVLLGVPYTDHEFFQTRTTTLVRQSTPPAERGAALVELRSYLGELIARKELEPGDDLLSRQLAKTESRDNLVGLAFLLLIGGHETTANMISLGTLALIEHPDVLAAVREDPAKIPGAVEELLRYFTIAEFANLRVAAEDVELGGALIRAGQGVIGLSNTGNRDPQVFDRSDELDIDRDARHHLTFGYGPHGCLGQNLARLELEIVFDTLFRKVPGLRLAVPADELPFKRDASIYGLYELPVSW